MSLMDRAREHVESQYVDHDHCAQSARAVDMFLKGVQWVAGQIKNPRELTEGGFDLESSGVDRKVWQYDRPD